METNDFQNKLQFTIMAAAINEKKKKPQASAHRTLTFSLCAAIAALAVVVTLVQPSAPEDTFTDPNQAYLQLESTLSYVNSKMNKGAILAQKANEPIDLITNFRIK